MKRSEFLDLVTRFSERPIPATINRHIYLWLGEMDDLLVKSPGGFFKKLDLHVLCQNISKTPYGDKAAGRELTNTVDVWLSNNFAPAHNQRALLVNGLDLIYRYRLPISTFMRLANENCMIVLLLSALDVNFRIGKPLPDYIQFAPDAILKYVGTEISQEAIIGEE